MANTLGGVNVAQIAEETLTYLSYSFYPLTAMATDFSEDIKEKGESVTTRIVSSVAPSDLSNGYTPSDVTSTAVKVDLNNFFGPVIEFKDLEATKAGDPDWLKNQFMEPSVEGLLDKVFQTVFAVVTNTNFPSNSVIAASNFDADDLADLGGELTKSKAPRKRRAAVLGVDWHTGVVKDSVVEDKSAFGDNQAIKEGVVSRVRGFNVYEYANIPNNGENLAGFVLHPSAIAFAARAVVDPTETESSAPVQVENVVDPVTGVPLQFRHWYNPDAGAHRFSIGVLWGVKEGNANALRRIKSAV